MSIADLALAGVPAVVNLVKALIPSLPSASASIVSSVVTVLTEWGPLIVKEYQELKPVVEDAIDMLEQSEHTTEETIATLRAQLAADKADFDAAVAASRAGDKDAGYS